MTPTGSTCRSLAALLAWAALSPAAQAAQTVKLNGPLAREFRARVEDVRLSPDGAWAVYEAPEDSQEPGLYSAPADGSASSRRLIPAGTAYYRFDVSSAWVAYATFDNVYSVPIDGSRAPIAVLPEAPQRSIDRIRISPDQGRVVYSATSSSGWGLYSARIDGDRAPALLSPVLAGLVWDFALSPDGRRAVFVADEVPNAIEIFSAPIDGRSAPVKLNRPLAAGGDVDHGQFRISPRSERVVFRSEAKLYSAPIDGRSSAVELEGTLVALGFEISPGGRRVVYLADPATGGATELYSVPIDGRAAAVRLNGVVAPAGDVQRFEISPDGARVLYLASEDGDAERELRSVPITGRSGSVPLSPVTSTDWPGFSPDGQRVVFASLERWRTDLYSVSLADGSGIRLPGRSRPNAGPLPLFQFARDGSVVYVESFGRGPYFVELLQVALDGNSAPVALAGPFPSGGLCSTNGEPLALATGNRVLMRADLGPGVNELLSVPLAGPRDVRRLNGPLVTDYIVADVTSLRIGPRGGRAAFTVRVGQGEDEHDELFSVGLDSHPLPIRLFGRPAVRILGLELSADGRHVAFRTGDGDEYRSELYGARADVRGPVVQLNDPTTSPRVGAFRFTADGQLVVFVAHQDQDEREELRAAPIGGGAEIELSGALVAGGSVGPFELTPDGSRAVYRADQRTAGTAELFSVPTDGSATPVVLSGPLVAGGDVRSGFQLSPDGRTVVYAADQEDDEVVALYRVPADGSAPPRRLDRAPIDGGDVLDSFRITPDGRRVLYLADRAVDEAFELYAVPSDASAGPVRLSGTLVAGGDVQPDFEVAPDGQCVVYRADAAEDQRFELYAAPLDGSTAPRRLNEPLVAGGDVLGALSYQPRPLRFTPDSARVVYRADAAVDERVELFSVPLDGSARPLPIAGAQAAGADVLAEFELTPDGASALYLADALADGRFELFTAPLAFPQAACRLSGPLVPGGDVVALHSASALVPFALAPGGEAVVYVADQDTDEVFELYLVLLPQPARAPLPASRP
ncbi:MAG TPA: hypothetical protein VF530_17105 [Planctomycetota bacterium]